MRIKRVREKDNREGEEGEPMEKLRERDRKTKGERWIEK